MDKTQKIKIYEEFAKSDKGKIRNENQDAYSYFESINGAVFAVCDGMGGIPEGKKAANITLKKIRKFICNEWYDNEKQLLRDAVNFANTEIRKKLGDPEKNIFPGTTIAMVLVRDNKVFYAHAGDSRIYYKTSKKMFLLTEDHSFVAKLARENKISKKEAEKSIRKNVIYNAVGIKENIQIDISEKPVEPADDDCVVLCTDGLTNELSDKEILNILNKEPADIKKKVKNLVEKALNKGGNDNITVAIIKFFNTGNRQKKFRPENKKRIKIFAVSGFLFLVINAIFMMKFFFFDKKENQKINKKQEKNISFDLITKSSEIQKNKTYNINEKFSFLLASGNKITDILKENKKRELFFYPGEKIIVPNDTKKQK